MARKPHIVIIVQSAGQRTIGQNAIKRGQLLSRRYSVSLVSDHIPASKADAIQTIPVAPRRFNYLRRLGHVPNEVSFSVAARKAVANLHNANPVDFILCHSYSICYLVGMHFSRHSKISYGMYMHGHIFTRPKGTYSWSLTKFYRWCAPKCYRKTPVILALSRAQKELAIAAGAPVNRVHILPNGISPEQIGLDSEMLANRSPVFSNDTIQLAYVGRCTPEKGFDVLIRACQILMSNKINFHLNVVGGSGMSEFAKNEISAGKNRSYFTCQQSIPRAEIGAFLQNSDILCLPSIDEPQGNIALESMISGCIVIGSDTGGIPDMIREGETGFLFPPGDAQSLALIIEQCTRNPDQCREIAFRAREEVVMKFEWESIVEKLGTIIDANIAPVWNP